MNPGAIPWYNRTMETATYQVTCGKVPELPTEEGRLLTFCLAGADAVKDAARHFARVIPDDLAPYLADIDAWDGQQVLEFSHQDDDYFIFRAQPAKALGLPDAFEAFVAEFDAGDPDDEG